MQHPRIDDEKVVDRYLAGRLPPDAEALFEEHLFECAGCLEKVEWGEELRRGLRAVAAEDAAHASISLGLVAWLRNRGPAQIAALAVLTLVVLLLPMVVLWQQAELARARAALADSGTGSSGASRGDSSLAEPLADFLVVSLGVVRDAAGEPAEIRPDPEKEAVLLSLELQTVDAARYRVTLRRAGGDVLWTREDLEPNFYDTLLVAFPSSFLAPGSYRITVEGLQASGAQPAGEMELRVVSR